MTGVIAGTGAYVPEYILKNQRLEEMVDTSDAWITERTGIKRRHIATHESTTFMAAEAAKRALANAGISPEELNLILVSTISGDMVMPGTACGVQKKIGAINAFCFDLSAACSGFVLAYNTAMAYMSAGWCKTVLIIGSESLSNLTDWADRSTCVLFGDGAGAVVVKRQEGEGFIPISHSDGTLGEALTLQSPFDHNPFTNENENIHKDTQCYMEMNGQQVFKFAVRKVPEVIEEVLKENHLRKEEIDLYLLHQANERIVEAVAKRLQESIEKFPMNMSEYGNTSSASIPILLDELHRERKLHAGMKLVLVGFGGGLTWGATIVTWDNHKEKENKNV